MGKLLLVAFGLLVAGAVGMGALPSRSSEEETLNNRLRHLGTGDLTDGSYEGSTLPVETEPEPKAPGEKGPAEYLLNELPAQTVTAKSFTGALDMLPRNGEPLDDDCDSPQIGETEASPGQAVDLYSIMANNTNGRMREQDEAQREVIEEDVSGLVPSVDHGSAFAGRPNTHPSEFEKPLNSDEGVRLEALPAPDPSVLKRIKCSRTKNGHDYIDGLDEIDEDCGAGEAPIPCETQGNTTKCTPPIVLRSLPPPPPEMVPQEPVGTTKSETFPEYFTMSIEFVDFGMTRDVRIHSTETVGYAVERAGIEYAIDHDNIQFIRSGGAKVELNSSVRYLPNPTQLIVYLSCIHRRFLTNSILRLPACELRVEKNYTARVEIPAHKAVYTVHFKTLEETVQHVVLLGPVDRFATEKVTYQGQSVELSKTLSSINFKNDTAFIVYPKEPCPSQSRTPSTSRTPTRSPSPSATRSQAPPSASPTPLPNIPEDGAVPIFDPPKPVNHDFVESENVMSEAVFMKLVFGKTDIIVRVLPSAKGRDLFDAVSLVTGKDSHSMRSSFNHVPIDSKTILKGFGFKNGDTLVITIDDTEMQH